MIALHVVNNPILHLYDICTMPASRPANVSPPRRCSTRSFFHTLPQVVDKVSNYVLMLLQSALVCPSCEGKATGGAPALPAGKFGTARRKNGRAAAGYPYIVTGSRRELISTSPSCQSSGRASVVHSSHAGVPKGYRASLTASKPSPASKHGHPGAPANLLESASEDAENFALNASASKLVLPSHGIHVGSRRRPGRDPRPRTSAVT
jgi:hypothetical protein